MSFEALKTQIIRSASVGNRNYDINKFAFACLDAGYGSDRLTAEVEDLNSRIFKPLQADEIQHIINHVERNRRPAGKAT